MERAYYEYRPSDYDEVVSAGIRTTILRFNIEEVDKNVFFFDYVEYNHKEPLTEDDYGKLVSCIIRGKYSEDDVEAIVNNYLDDPDGHKSEFDELQKWRSIAKQRAREIIDSVAE